MRKKICFINAIKDTAEILMKPHFVNLQQDYEVHYVACNVSEGSDSSFPGTICHRVDIARPISIIKDLKAVYSLYKVFRHERFDAVHSITPKAGLVTALAARMAGIKVRSHTFTGQVWATRKGFMRTLLRMMDRIIVALDNNIFVDAEAQRQHLISEGILKDSNSRVLANGSLLGADMNRFCPDAKTRQKQRNDIGISDSHFVFAFLGRLNVDKGIRELLEAFDRLVAYASEKGAEKSPYLLLVGDDEENMTALFSQHPNIHQGSNFCAYGSTPVPDHVMQAADVFVLPTYREGFPQSPLEAGALALPIIISDIYGTKASIINDVTGLRCNPQDTDSLYAAMKQMFDNPEKAKAMGQAGRKYIAEKYDQKILEKAWMDLYQGLMLNA